MTWAIIITLAVLLLAAIVVLIKRYRISKWLRIYAENFGLAPKPLETDAELRKRILRWVSARPFACTLDDCRDMFAAGSGLRVSDVVAERAWPGTVRILVPRLTRTRTIERGRSYLVSQFPFGLDIVVERR
jgi:hypothetical protein